MSTSNTPSRIQRLKKNIGAVGQNNIGKSILSNFGLQTTTDNTVSTKDVSLTTKALPYISIFTVILLFITFIITIISYQNRAADSTSGENTALGFTIFLTSCSLVMLIILIIFGYLRK
jgi:heme/copper-type cytochrome/quinol oxidase subunit 2